MEKNKMNEKELEKVSGGYSIRNGHISVSEEEYQALKDGDFVTTTGKVLYRPEKIQEYLRNKGFEGYEDTASIVGWGSIGQGIASMKEIDECLKSGFFKKVDIMKK